MTEESRASGEKTAEMLSPKEVAARPNVTDETSRRWVRAGLIDAARVVNGVVRIPWPLRDVPRQPTVDPLQAEVHALSSDSEK